MSTIKETETQWRVLNEYQSDADSRVSQKPDRDLERNPWSSEDDENVRRMVQEMTGRLARIEERVAVIYRISHAVLGTTKFVAGVVVVIAVGFLFHRVFGW